MSALTRLEALKREVAVLEKAAAGEIAQKKLDTVRAIAEQMVATEVTLDDITQYLRHVSAKYTDGKNTWSGRGKKPDWLKAAVARGVKLEDLRVGKAAPVPFAPAPVPTPFTKDLPFAERCGL